MGECTDMRALRAEYEVIKQYAENTNEQCIELRNERDSLRRDVAALVDVLIKKNPCIIYNKHPTKPPCVGQAVTSEVCRGCVTDWAKQAAQAGKDVTP